MTTTYLKGFLQRCPLRSMAFIALLGLGTFPLQAQKSDSTRAVAPIDYPTVLTRSLRDGMDTTVSPCVDFDRFINGSWKATAVLPDSVQTYGLYHSVGKQTEQLLGVLFDSARRVQATTKDARFAQAFGCKEGDPMAKPADQRAKIW